jgi:hypothetical protein
MFTLVITTVVLAVLYGLAWHDQPAGQSQPVKTPNRE